MTGQERVSALWELLREDYGINTMEQFVEAYTRCPPIHISAFVEPGATSFFPKT